MEWLVTKIPEVEDKTIIVETTRMRILEATLRSEADIAEGGAVMTKDIGWKKEIAMRMQVRLNSKV